MQKKTVKFSELTLNVWTDSYLLLILRLCLVLFTIVESYFSIVSVYFFVFSQWFGLFYYMKKKINLKVSYLKHYCFVIGMKHGRCIYTCIEIPALLMMTQL